MCAPSLWRYTEAQLAEREQRHGEMPSTRQKKDVIAGKRCNGITTTPSMKSRVSSLQLGLCNAIASRSFGVRRNETSWKD